MTLEVRRVVSAAVAAGALVVAAVSVPSMVGALSAQAQVGVPGWTPVTSGLTAEPDELLPERISSGAPVVVVTTTLDAAGRPVVTERRATDRQQAQALIRAGQQTPGALAVELDETVRVLDVSTGTDEYRDSQWDLTKLNIPTAWSRATGAGVTVAVIDSGVDASHPDLAGQVLPGIDLVADTTGTSVDPHGHGTHVAGTIAAVTGNGTGVAAVAPEARILPIRVLGSTGSGSMSDVATGIVHATDQNAQIINMSLGASSPTASVANAIAYARAHGVTVVAAAGNYRTFGSPTSYPAADEGVIGVASTDSNDNYSSFSNQGTYVDVAAPGSGILSTYPVGKGSYSAMSGTSMAAPHVAAVAALLKSADPTLTPDEIQQALQSTALDLGAPGKDVDYGWGRIDPVAALTATVPVTPPTTPPTTAPTTPPTTTAPTTGPPSVTPTSSAPTSAPAPSIAPTAPRVVPPTTTPPFVPAPTLVPTPGVTKSPAPTLVPTPGVTKSPAPVKVTPVVAVKTTARTVDHGSTSTTTFTVTAANKPWSHQRASVCVAGSTGPFTCTATTTAADGTVRYSRGISGRYSVRLVVSATATSPQVTSPTVTYQPRALVHLSKTGRGAVTATLAGTAGQTVRLQRLAGRSWITVVSYRAVARRTVSGLRAGTRYRLVVPTVPAVTGATSAAVRL